MTPYRVSADLPDGTIVEQRDRGDLDEIVVGDWLHVERMGDRGWSVQIGDARFYVETTRRGVATVYVTEAAIVAGAKGTATLTDGHTAMVVPTGKRREREGA